MKKYKTLADQRLGGWHSSSLFYEWIGLDTYISQISETVTTSLKLLSLMNDPALYFMFRSLSLDLEWDGGWSVWARVWPLLHYACAAPESLQIQTETQQRPEVMRHFNCRALTLLWLFPDPSLTLPSFPDHPLTLPWPSPDPLPSCEPSWSFPPYLTLPWLFPDLSWPFLTPQLHLVKVWRLWVLGLEWSWTRPGLCPGPRAWHIIVCARIGQMKCQMSNKLDILTLDQLDNSKCKSGQVIVLQAEF